MGGRRTFGFFLDQRKHAKLQWLQNPKQGNEDNPNNLRREASRHFRNKKKEYLKANIGELEIKGKLKNIRDLYRGNKDFKKSYQPRTNTERDEMVNLATDCHCILVG